jgi:ankyrin repeat protein
MKYLRLFEDFDSYDPYELMIIPPNKKAGMIVGEIWKDEPNLNLVRDLIVLGANVNWQDEENFNRTPLHWAVRDRSVEIARMLIDAGADLNVQDKDGWTPLHWAAEYNGADIVRMLIGAGANVNVQDEWGKT